MGQDYEFRLQRGDQVFVLPRGSVDIGRDASCDIQVDEDLVSRHHARISVEPERLVFRDLGSSNGSRVNDNPIEGPLELRNGDRIRIGLTVLEVKAIARRRVDTPTLRLVSCPTCGAIVSDTMAFCVQCGSRLPERPKIQRCSVCNELIPPNRAICPNCGEPSPQG